jgi:hypothetical protein
MLKREMRTVRIKTKASHPRQEGRELVNPPEVEKTVTEKKTCLPCSETERDLRQQA